MRPRGGASQPCLSGSTPARGKRGRWGPAVFADRFQHSDWIETWVLPQKWCTSPVGGMLIAWRPHFTENSVRAGKRNPDRERVVEMS
jgi:hypothetical protein